METPDDQIIRRSTRNALSEIPTHLGVVSMADRDGNGRRILNNNTQNIFFAVNGNFLEGTNLLPTTFLSPSPSPDEMIIRQRGRRRIPVTFSPDIDELKRQNRNNQKDRTPVKQPPSPGPSSSIVLRSTPRKRLLLSDPTEVGTSFDNSPKSSPKKNRTDNIDSSIEGISDTLKAFTSNQLITVIKKLLSKRPELEKDLIEIIPEPDLRPLEQHLTFLKKNITKALPTSRLSSKTDAIAYHRAASHLAAFKKAVTDQGRRLSESKQWNSVMDYVSIAWKLVRMIPIFDNPAHNMPRRQCFKFLAAQCLLSIRNANFNAEQLLHYFTRMKNFITDSDEFKQCMIQLENKATV
ncbi:uncharacterized protein LOC135836768 [Planococcus citri]|uniref:uncharacterized protein LOC135836768 n=1 Tax=Planococcus citri TaxID=170843 RepID=UPI0031F9AA60